MSRRLLVTTALCLFASSLFAQETNLATQLQKWNEEIKKTPDEPMSYYRKAQCLMGLGQYDEGYQCAKDAMEKFIKKNHNLAWMLVEKIDFPNYRVDVHFNMGPDERQLPDMGIIHPVSFRIWSKDEDSELLDVFDYEIGLFDGKPSTAAIGQTTGSGNVLNNRRRGLSQPQRSRTILESRSLVMAEIIPPLPCSSWLRPTSGRRRIARTRLPF